jgi:general stress protein 26
VKRVDGKIVAFLEKHRVCSLTTMLPDNIPHAAALHYSTNGDLFELYFSTEKSSKKCEGLLSGKTVKSSLVVGFSEEEWVTLQMDGEVEVVSDNDLEKVQKIHYARHPNSAKYKDKPETIFLKFTPKWWRYTDYNTDPLTIISSDN